jgi:hypothetical protein
VRAADGIWAGHRDLLLQAYAACNAQDVEALLARISDDVDWPDGAGRLHGKEQVRAYRTEQRTRPRTHDEPLSFSELDDGRAAVYIRQVVRPLDGSPIPRGHFLHMHRIEGGPISRAWTSSASASCARSDLDS